MAKKNSKKADAPKGKRGRPKKVVAPKVEEIEKDLDELEEDIEDVDENLDLDEEDEENN